jgi:hypothetical protein
MASSTYTAVPNLLGKNTFSMRAGEAIEANRALKLSTEGLVLHTAAITDFVIGVALTTVAIGEMVEIAPSGTIVKMQPGAAVAIGARVMPEGSGAGVVITLAGATAVPCGIAKTEAGAAGELFEVFLLTGMNALGA